MSKRSKIDRKRLKRAKSALKKKQFNRMLSANFFKIVGDFPYDLKREIIKTINKHPFDNKEWKKNLSDYRMLFALIDGMLKLSINQDVFYKYFPNISIGCYLHSDNIIIFPYKTERVILDNQDCYLLPNDVKIPLCAGHQIVFSKHAMERFMRRYIEEHDNVDYTYSQISLRYSLMINGIKDADFDTIYINDVPHLRCYGFRDSKVDLTYGKGLFPIIYRKDKALAKTFLYDKWV